MSKPVLPAVDDDNEVLRAVDRDLKQKYAADYRVLRAESGQVSLDTLKQLKLRNEPVALLLVDQRMPPEINSRIFDPFFTTKDVGKGTGLGLDIAYHIVVRRHHGEISVESKPGETRFLVRLPLAPPRQRAPGEK